MVLAEKLYKIPPKQTGRVARDQADYLDSGIVSTI